MALRTLSGRHSDPRKGRGAGINPEGRFETAERESYDNGFRDMAFMTGILSLLDTLLGLPMPEAVAPLALPDEVREALLRRSGPLGRLLIRGEPGAGIVDELAPRVGEIVIDKPGFSAFESTALGPMLSVRGIRTLILCGITTEVCVSSTLRTAIDRSFRCVTLRDACASAYPDLHDAAMRMIQVEGGVFGEVAEVDTVAAALERL